MTSRYATYILHIMDDTTEVIIEVRGVSQKSQKRIPKVQFIVMLDVIFRLFFHIKYKIYLYSETRNTYKVYANLIILKFTQQVSRKCHLRTV